MDSGRIDRRTFFRRSLALGAAASVVQPFRAVVASVGQPFRAAAANVLTAQLSRPQIPQGVTAGDVTHERALIWSRADRASRMFVVYDTTDRFTNPRRVAGPAAL